MAEDFLWEYQLKQRIERVWEKEKGLYLEIARKYEAETIDELIYRVIPINPEARAVLVDALRMAEEYYGYETRSSEVKKWVEILRDEGKEVDFDEIVRLYYTEDLADHLEAVLDIKYKEQLYRGIYLTRLDELSKPQALLANAKEGYELAKYWSDEFERLFFRARALALQWPDMKRAVDILEGEIDELEAERHEVRMALSDERLHLEQIEADIVWHTEIYDTAVASRRYWFYETDRLYPVYEACIGKVTDYEYWKGLWESARAQCVSATEEIATLTTRLQTHQDERDQYAADITYWEGLRDALQDELDACHPVYPDLLEARDNLALAQTHYDEARIQREAAEEDYETAETNLAVAQEQVASLQADLDALQADYEYCKDVPDDYQTAIDSLDAATTRHEESAEVLDKAIYDYNGAVLAVQTGYDNLAYWEDERDRAHEIMWDCWNMEGFGSPLCSEYVDAYNHAVDTINFWESYIEGYEEEEVVPDSVLEFLYNRGYTVPYEFLYHYIMDLYWAIYYEETDLDSVQYWQFKVDQLQEDLTYCLAIDDVYEEKLILYNMAVAQREDMQEQRDQAAIDLEWAQDIETLYEDNLIYWQGKTSRLEAEWVECGETEADYLTYNNNALVAEDNYEAALAAIEKDQNDIYWATQEAQEWCDKQAMYKDKVDEIEATLYKCPTYVEDYQNALENWKTAAARVESEELILEDLQWQKTWAEDDIWEYEIRLRDLDELLSGKYQQLLDYLEILRDFASARDAERYYEEMVIKWTNKMIYWEGQVEIYKNQVLVAEHNLASAKRQFDYWAKIWSAWYDLYQAEPPWGAPEPEEIMLVREAFTLGIRFGLSIVSYQVPPEEELPGGAEVVLVPYTKVIRRFNDAVRAGKLPDPEVLKDKTVHDRHADALDIKRSLA